MVRSHLEFVFVFWQPVLRRVASTERALDIQVDPDGHEMFDVLVANSHQGKLCLAAIRAGEQSVPYFLPGARGYLFRLFSAVVWPSRLQKAEDTHLFLGSRPLFFFFSVVV